MNDRPLFAVVGEALYGPAWKKQLADDLKVNDRSLRRWIQTGEVPPGVWNDLKDLMSERQAALNALLAAISDRT